MICGLSKWVVAWTIACAIRAGSSLLKMPEPTKTPSAPSCITSAASAGVAMPPATKLTTGSLPSAATSWTSSNGASSSLAATNSSSSRMPCRRRMSASTSRMWRTASTMLPVPASPLVRIIAAPSLMRRSASPRSRQPQTNGTLKACLSMWLRLVGRRQHLGLVDVVDAERLEDLRLDEVADAGLGHDRDGHRVHDPVDHRRVAHAGDAAGGADVGRHALERHDGDGAGVLGDLGLLGRDDVHDDAALEHLGEALLGRPGRRFDGHVWVGSGLTRSGLPAVLAPGSSPVRAGRAASRAWIIARSHPNPTQTLERQRCGAAEPVECPQPRGSHVKGPGARLLDTTDREGSRGSQSMRKWGFERCASWQSSQWRVSWLLAIAAPAAARRERQQPERLGQGSQRRLVLGRHATATPTSPPTPAYGAWGEFYEESGEWVPCDEHPASSTGSSQPCTYGWTRGPHDRPRFCDQLNHGSASGTLELYSEKRQ